MKDFFNSNIEKVIIDCRLSESQWLQQYGRQKEADEEWFNAGWMSSVNVGDAKYNTISIWISAFHLTDSQWILKIFFIPNLDKKAADSGKQLNSWMWW